MMTPTEWFFTLLTISNPDHAQYNTITQYPYILVEHPRLFDSIDEQYRKQKYRVSESFLDQHIDLMSPFIKKPCNMKKSNALHFYRRFTWCFTGTHK